VNRAARIAIVDDDPMFVDYLATFLRTRGYDADVHQSGAALLQTLSSAEPPDAVLLDVLMPNMNGLETLRALRDVNPGMPVIMLSGQHVPSTIVDAVRLGAVDYVVKSDGSAALHEAALEAAICRAMERTSLTSEVARLSARLGDEPDGSQMFWSSRPAMSEIMTMIDRVADSDVSVLLTGESGVGKEVIARELHRRSPRRSHPFVKVNCAALPSELLESELFGHERGAFTGAHIARVGKFEFAHEGTLLLDEIGEMAVGLQAKLLHVLQDREITKIGSNKPIPVDVRVIAATNRELAGMLQSGQFREDLYYRLQVIEIRVPPLRERRDEILPLTEFFLRSYAKRYGRPPLKPSAAVRQALMSYQWPGNIRELENMLKRYVILRDEAMILGELQRERPVEPAAPPAIDGTAQQGPAPAAAAPTPRADVAEPAGNGRGGKLPDLARAAALAAEREAIQHALDRLHWNRRKAAAQLGVSYKTLLNKMKECGITAPAEAESNSTR
jgi:two-component system response regulator AtoC